MTIRDLEHRLRLVEQMTATTPAEAEYKLRLVSLLQSAILKQQIEEAEQAARLQRLTAQGRSRYTAAEAYYLDNLRRSRQGPMTMPPIPGQRVTQPFATEIPVSGPERPPIRHVGEARVVRLALPPATEKEEPC